MLKLIGSLSLLPLTCSILLAVPIPKPAPARSVPSLPAVFSTRTANAAIPNLAQQHNATETQREYNTEVTLTKEVRHQLVMQPFYTVFDNLEFKLDGEEVTLMGQVANPALKSGAASAVKRIEGVTSVKNEIQVLPPSPDDNRLRLALYRAIYSNPGFEKYATQAVPPIHIIVDLGHVTLTGIVANQMDKTLALTRANQVPGTVGKVTDHLRVENQGGR
ncbi:MAG: BON domain-containing protein [Acidobacteriota bacterium]|nr:BON domain-containing protein [Acidobacteriota bacterium]